MIDSCFQTLAMNKAMFIIYREPQIERFPRFSGFFQLKCRLHRKCLSTYEKSVWSVSERCHGWEISGTLVLDKR